MLQLPKSNVVYIISHENGQTESSGVSLTRLIEKIDTIIIPKISNSDQTNQTVTLI